MVKLAKLVLFPNLSGIPFLLYQIFVCVGHHLLLTVFYFFYISFYFFKILLFFHYFLSKLIFLKLLIRFFHCLLVAYFSCWVNNSLPLSCKIESSRFIQSCMYMGVCCCAMVSAKAKYCSTNKPNNFISSSFK